MNLGTYFFSVTAIILALNILQEVDSQCTYLTAYSYTSTLESHSDYGSENYDDNMDECWVITANSWSGMVVKLESESFNTEHHYSCLYDYLQLYDSSTQSGDDITYCGYDGSFTIYSSGSSIYLRFETDGSTTASGFSLKYSEVALYNYDSSLWTNTYESFSSDSNLDDILSSIVIGFWAIVGIVIGSIILVIVVVIVVIVVVVVCVIGASSSGTVQPARRNGTTVVQRGQVSYTNSNRPGGAVMIQPPAYGQPYGHANPSYSQQTAMSHGGHFIGVQQQQQYGGYGQQPVAVATTGAVASTTAAGHQPTSIEVDNGGVPPPPVYHDPETHTKKY